MSKKIKKIVCMGGGTGVSMVLSGLIDYPLELNAVVTMFDDGGSSGKLAKDFHILPPGDIRQCLVATSKEKDFIEDFRYRFDRGFLKGHNWGNLMILKAVNEERGDWNKAIEKLSRKLNIKTKIYPVTLENAKIKAVLKNGRRVTGEENIINSKTGIKSLFLEPAIKANLKAVSALKKADLIAIGPGKFYTSIMPNILVGGIAEAIRKSKAKKVFICNLMAQENNVADLKVEDFVGFLEKSLGKNIDYVIFNTGKFKPALLKKVKKIFPQAAFVSYGKDLLKDKKFIGQNILDNRLRKLNPADILVKGANQRTIVFHDSKKLAKILMGLIGNKQIGCQRK